MKTCSYIIFLIFLFSVSACKDNSREVSKNSGQNGLSQADTLSVGKTYAEISIKQGGSWKQNKYTEGKFVNVDSISVPAEHIDHSGFIRYEGPGWENNQVAYRLYLDWRNGIDVFGKKVDSLVLPYVGSEDLESYHDNKSWGMDILKAGNSLGIGGFGRYVNDSVHHFRKVGKTIVNVENLDSSSEVHIQYKDWETAKENIDLKAVLSIFPDDLFTKVELETTTPVTGLCTGMVRNDKAKFTQKGLDENGWKDISSYGKQSLSGKDDNLGLAIFYKSDEISEVKGTEHDHLIIFKPAEKVSYYLLAARDKQKDGIRNATEFQAYLESILKRLNSDELI